MSGALPQLRPAAVELFWIPLGAGGHCVKLSGRIFEAARAGIERRASRRLFHTALLVRIEGRTFGIEQTPAWGQGRLRREVVAEGPVGSRLLGGFKAFRYEVHIAPGGGIPDLEEAVAGPRLLSTDPAVAKEVLCQVRGVPAMVWGRGCPICTEMWNSNSVVAWTLVRSGIEAGSLEPPPGGAAPGWRAGVEIAKAGASDSACLPGSASSCLSPQPSQRRSPWRDQRRSPP